MKNNTSCRRFYVNMNKVPRGNYDENSISCSSQIAEWESYGFINAASFEEALHQDNNIVPA